MPAERLTCTQALEVFHGGLAERWVTHRLALGYTVALVGVQDVQPEVVLAGDDAQVHELVGAFLTELRVLRLKLLGDVLLDPLDGAVHDRTGLLVVALQGPYVLAPVHLRLAGAHCAEDEVVHVEGQTDS